MFVCPIYILLLSICEPTFYHVWTTLHFLSKGVITLAKKGNGWRVKCDKGPVAVGRRSGLDQTTSGAEDDDDRIFLFEKVYGQYDVNTCR